jgi:hypothetical protein
MASTSQFMVSRLVNEIYALETDAWQALLRTSLGKES